MPKTFLSQSDFSAICDAPDIPVPFGSTMRRPWTTLAAIARFATVTILSGRAACQPRGAGGCGACGSAAYLRPYAHRIFVTMETTPRGENTMRGILLLLAATLFFSISDVLAKVLGERVPVIEIGWIRYLTFFVIILGVGAREGKVRLRVNLPGAQLVRGAMMVVSALFFIFALRFLPIADAAAVGFVSPLLITALSVPMLGEVVGLRRWTAIAVGFIGVLIVIRPGTGTFQPAAFLVLASSLAWAVATILTRRIAGRDDASATMMWAAMVGLCLLSVAVPFVYVGPSWSDIALNVALGTFATIGQYWMLLAYRNAPASLLAPFNYVQLIWSTASGWMVFGTLPDEMTLLGAAIITASGLYTIHRERIRARERAAVN
jgi:drug/metabolite transporter (DMT)-like permease